MQNILLVYATFTLINHYDLLSIFQKICLNLPGNNIFLEFLEDKNVIIWLILKLLKQLLLAGHSVIDQISKPSPFPFKTISVK